jgi:hypothetical protein
MINKFTKIVLIVVACVALILVSFLIINKTGLFLAEFKQEWKSCNNDQDCTLVSTPGCYSCGKDAVNSKFVNEYNNYRSSNTWNCWGVVATQCMLEFKVPRCENNVCIATDKCSNDSDCSSVDCSRLNSGVKSGYQPYCIENKCKCMCYGCK